MSKLPPPEDPSFRGRLDEAKRASTLQLLFKAARLLDERAVARLAQKHGLPQLRRSHMSVLPHLDLDGTRITVLADRLGVSKQAASQLIDDLEAFGVVARAPDPDDARARRVVFTKRGREGFFEGLATLKSMEEELSSAIGKARMRALHEALGAILEEMERTQQK